MKPDRKKCYGPCGKVKKLDEFASRASGLHGRGARCRICANQYERELRARKSQAKKGSVLLDDVDQTWDAVLCQEVYLGRLSAQ